MGLNGFANWLTAGLFGAAAAVIVLSGLTLIEGAQPRLVTDTGYSAFTISIWPALAIVAISMLTLEKVGFRSTASSGVLLFALTAPVAGFAGLALFVWFAYDYPVCVKTIAADWHLALSLLTAGGIYGVIRNNNR